MWVWRIAERRGGLSRLGRGNVCALCACMRATMRVCARASVIVCAHASSCRRFRRRNSPCRPAPKGVRARVCVCARPRGRGCAGATFFAFSACVLILSESFWMRFICSATRRAQRVATAQRDTLRRRSWTGPFRRAAALRCRGCVTDTRGALRRTGRSLVHRNGAAPTAARAAAVTLCAGCNVAPRAARCSAW
jgi:hypothetical protein